MAGKLVFEIPSAQTPGYLRRAKIGLEFKAKMRQGVSPATIDDMVAFLADFVTEPKNRDEAIEALFDASEEQFTELIDLITGEGQTENPTADGKSSMKSEPSETEQQP
ncbi:MAG TPA: hypothetical protein VMW53_07505 [archaeon]|nr:hypothetical protein [archaeon]